MQRFVALEAKIPENILSYIISGKHVSHVSDRKNEKKSWQIITPEKLKSYQSKIARVLRQREDKLF